MVDFKSIYNCAALFVSMINWCFNRSPKIVNNSKSLRMSQLINNSVIDVKGALPRFPEKLENSLEFGDVNKCAVTPLIIDQTLFIKQCFPHLIERRAIY